MLERSCPRIGCTSGENLWRPAFPAIHCKPGAMISDNKIWNLSNQLHTQNAKI
jgi:hypothetical protein